MRRPRWKPWTVMAGFGLAATLAFAIFGWRSAARHAPPVARVRASYVDPARCQACHADVYRSYKHVGMARSFAPASKASAIEDYETHNHFFHARSGRYYEVLRRNGRVYQRRYELDSHGRESNAFEQEANFAVGSGNHARTFLHQSDSGELTELPVTWYSQEGRWWMSPGYDNSVPADFTRPADDSCLFCHNGYPAGRALAEGIDCQRCHGPGSRHVELASGGKTVKEVQSAIVNPARLSPELQMDVCMQCHLETTSAELPGMVRRFEREQYSFRPGEPLGAYMVHFDQANQNDRFEIVNQAYRLRRSRCFQQSLGRLTCVTCHNPHDVPHGADAVAHYRVKCISCHPSPSVANHPDAGRADCAACHMPRRRTEDAVHVIMTDHLISRRPPLQDVHKPLAERDRTYHGPLVIYYPERLSERERDLYLGVALITGSADRRGGIALLERLGQSSLPAKAMAVLGEGYFEEGSVQAAIGMFRQAAAKDPSLGKVHYNLGRALEAAGQTQDARSEYENSIRLGVPLPESHYALANLLVRAGAPAMAIQHYQAAIRARPVYSEAHNNLANVYADQGRLTEARNEVEQALRIDPEFAEAHNNLARVLAAQNQIPDAIDHARRAVALNPKYVEGRYNLAKLLQAAGLAEAAVEQYRRTLEIRPDLVEAHLGLGQTLGDQGRLDAAISEFREVLRLRPGHIEAQRNLDLALSMRGGGRP